jgi:hypothetical protein
LGNFWDISSDDFWDFRPIPEEKELAQPVQFSVPKSWIAKRDLNFRTIAILCRKAVISTLPQQETFENSRNKSF